MKAHHPRSVIPASSAASYYVEDWRAHYEALRSGRLKQLAYSALWPLFNAEASRWLSRSTIHEHAPSGVFRERGFPVEARRRWALSQLDVKNLVILVQGTGSGWDVLTWARLRPKRVIATDLFRFEGWDEVAKFCARSWNVECEFRQAPLEDHSFLAAGSVDICVSDMVFEHCRNLTEVLVESHRVLKVGGRLYAAYGPLWFCGGGDHYSGRGGLRNIYNHLVLSPGDYRQYLDECREDSEDFQTGYRYAELDLFSRLTTAQYLRSFRSTGFHVDDLILDISSAALQFRKTYPSQYTELIAATAGRCTPDDLLVKSNLVKLTRH